MTSKLIVFTTLLVLFLVFVSPALLSLMIKYIPSASQPGYNVDNRFSVYGNFVAEQGFISQEDRLSGIAMTIGNPNLNNKKDIKLILREGESVVREAHLSGLNIEDGAFVKFVFDSIVDSKGKAYTFTLESPEAGAEQVINIYFTKQKYDWMSDVKLGDEELPGAMPFVTLHTPVSKMSLVGKIYRDLLARIF